MEYLANGLLVIFTTVPIIIASNVIVGIVIYFFLTNPLIRGFCSFLASLFGRGRVEVNTDVDVHVKDEDEVEAETEDDNDFETFTPGTLPNLLLATVCDKASKTSMEKSKSKQDINIDSKIKIQTKSEEEQEQEQSHRKLKQKLKQKKNLTIPALPRLLLVSPGPTPTPSQPSSPLLKHSPKHEYRRENEQEISFQDFEIPKSHIRKQKRAGKLIRDCFASVFDGKDKSDKNENEDKNMKKSKRTKKTVNKINTKTTNKK